MVLILFKLCFYYKKKTKVPEKKFQNSCVLDLAFLFLQQEEFCTMIMMIDKHVWPHVCMYVPHVPVQVKSCVYIQYIHTGTRVLYIIYMNHVEHVYCIVDI